MGACVKLKISVGETALDAVPLDQFDESAGFLDHWESRVVPAPAVINHWDHLRQRWMKPRLKGPISLRTGLQCLVADTFGVRDTAAEQAMFARICSGLQVSASDLRDAVARVLPAARFTVDPDTALSAEQKALRSWDVEGCAHFSHFVLRAPVGRISDWVLVSAPTDFTLRARLAAVPIAAPRAHKTEGALAERMSDFLMARTEAGTAPAQGLTNRLRH